MEKFEAERFKLTSTKATLYIKVLHNQFKLPEKIPSGDWIDLATVEDIKYRIGEAVVIRLGFAAKLPENFEAHILPRSSTFRRYGLIHASSGLIDESYCGDNDEWMFVCYTCRDGKIPAGTRVCQFRITQKMPDISFQIVDKLPGENRGGFGSTGR